jgi:hypothetical protein
MLKENDQQANKSTGVDCHESPVRVISLHCLILEILLLSASILFLIGVLGVSGLIEYSASHFLVKRF